MFLGFLALPLTGSAPAEAQTVGETVRLTGCLAQDEDDGETEYLLEHAVNAMGEDVSATEIELIPGGGVNLAPHVGHTVEVSGAVVADDEEDEGEETEMEDEDENELHIRVRELGHVSASCRGG
ncbi:MAG TPA: hypothetical protein VLL48_07185 [Longimicrobiales bacterium]|nr:hypothetical protein [Longimicrobiales bacterium]